MARREPIERWAERAPRSAKVIVANDTFDDDDLGQREMFRRILGDDAYLKLLEYSGGCRLNVPHKPARSKLAHAIGLEATGKLSANLAGLYITIPLDREFRVRALRQQGKSARQIALTIGISELGVRKMLWRLRDKERDRAGK